MPLISDPEYQTELLGLRDSIASKYKTHIIASLAVYLTVIIGFCVVINYLDIPDTFKLSLVVAFCSFLIIAAIKSMVMVLHTAITVLVGTVEWVGRKQLGEYQEPEK